MTDVSIEDDYDTTPGVVTLDKLTKTAILNVTFNKDYKGDLYIINSKYEKSLDDHDDNVINFAGGITAKLNEVSTKSGLTNKAATTAGKGDGIYYENEDGSLDCKLMVNLKADATATMTEAAGAVARGSSYYLVFDQADVDDDEITAEITKDGLNTSDDMVVPYVEAPASIKVSNFNKGKKQVKVEADDENGDKLAWFTANGGNAGTLASMGLTSAKIYKIDTNAKASDDSSVTPATQAVKKGEFTFTTLTDINNKYVYAKLATVAGVFAKDSLTLETEISESAISAVDSISLKEDSTEPTSAVVEFKGLNSKAPGTVYIMQGNATAEKLTAVRTDSTTNNNTDLAANATAYEKIKNHELTDAVGSAKVEGGAASVTIPNIFNADQMLTAGKNNGNDAFVAVFVPDDEDLWMRADSRSETTHTDGTTKSFQGFQLTPVITSSDKENIAATLTSETDVTAESAGGKADGKAASIKLTITGIQLKDQFGNDWTGTDDLNGLNAVAVSTTKKVAAHDESGSGKVTYDGDGKVTLVANLDSLDPAKAGGNSYFDKGETFTYTIAGLKGLTVAVSTKHAIQADNGNTQIKLDKNDSHPTDNTFEVNIADGKNLTNGLQDAFSVS